ncbi:M12 family metallopeptidase [Cryptosporangium minutisporangium]|uniref:Peptidase M12A domain-containing protein n=1 Tax=Cryptosporangium minutisporangium TaxID=113569 RepID=A0ABP6T5G5_9ACTN
MSETTGAEQSTGTGYVFGETFDVRPVVYGVRDGLAVFEGDIVLGTVEEMAARTAFVEGPIADRLAVAGPGVLPAVALPAGRSRWPDGVVPYEVDPALPEAQRVAAEDAVVHWNTQTRLTLVPRSSETDYLRFVPGGGCSSPVGRQGGPQHISLGSGCFFGQATHEIGHAVGLWHEQSREDRDSFVRIVWENIDAALRHNFDQHITDGDDVGPYDYGSIMHYPAAAFSVNGEPTIAPVQPEVSIGQRSALSPGDRAGIRAIYPDLEPSASNTWVGAFSGNRSEVLYYLRSRRTWQLGSAVSGSLVWTVVGGSDDFGPPGGGWPIWVVRSGDRDRLLCHSPADGNWWLGSIDGTLTWSLVGNRQYSGLSWTGRFSADSAQVLMHSPADGNWWLGSVDSGALEWSFAGNTAGFTADVSTLHVGDFDGDGRDNLLVEDAGEWWLATLRDDRFEWRVVGNTVGAERAAPVVPVVDTALRAQVTSLQGALRAADVADRGPVVRELLTLRASLARAERGPTPVAPAQPAPWPNFGALDDGRPFWVGRYSADRDQLLFYSPADANWWLGSMVSGSLQWEFAGNTLVFGALDDGRPFWVGRFAGGRDQVLFYSPADGNWWAGTWGSAGLQWAIVGNTLSSGSMADGRSIWAGRFTGATDQLLTYRSEDGACRLGTYDGSTLSWTSAGTFEA